MHLFSDELEDSERKMDTTEIETLETVAPRVKTRDIWEI